MHLPNQIWVKKNELLDSKGNIVFSPSGTMENPYGMTNGATRFDMEADQVDIYVDG